MPPTNVTEEANLQLGLAAPRTLRTVCVHEFGYSFVNPVIDQVSPQVLATTAALFQPSSGADGCPRLY